MAVADTLGAAWAAAHFMERPLSFLPVKSSPRFAACPIEALRLPDDVIDLLHSLGIYSIGQLEQLPRADLAARFGPRLAERWDQALGRLAEPILAQAIPPELEAGTAWSTRPCGGRSWNNHGTIDRTSCGDAGPLRPWDGPTGLPPRLPAGWMR